MTWLMLLLCLCASSVAALAQKNAAPGYIVLEKGDTRDLSYVDPIEMVVKLEDSTRTEALLLQRIYLGSNLSLFYYQDVVKEHFFVYDNDKMQELIIRYKTGEA